VILRFALLLAAAPAALVSAQQAPAPAAPRTAQAMPEDEDTITVSTQRLPGQVVGDIKPELTLGTQELRALGAGSITEILAQIAPQTQSGRGRGGGPPAVLLNGKRTSGFQEIRNIPPEAIARVEVLPEEVALKYGFRADQRVINFVLRPRFQAWTGEFDIGGPTDGGRFSSELEVNLLRLRDGTRTSIEAEVEINTLLTEAERRITTPPQSRPFALDGNVSALLSGAEVVPGRTVLGVPAGVAAALRCPDRRVIAFVGDGGALMTGGEYAVAVARGAPLKLVLSDNGSYASIRIHQERAHPGRVSGTSLINPDFAQWCAAFRVPVTVVENKADFPALEAALAAPGAAAIVVRTSLQAVLPRR
jgi:hypothetical protein